MKNKRFIDFVKEYIGNDYLAIAGYYHDFISNESLSCNIQWSDTFNRITWDGKKNRGQSVIGSEKEDIGRVYVWAEIREYKQDGDSFTYPFIAFKNMRNSIGKPNYNFNPLQALYREYELYKKTKIHNKATILPKKITTVETEDINFDKIDKELKSFEKMVHIKNELGLFSAYLKNNKRIGNVVNEFNIKLGSDYHGYFTCIPLYNINYEIKSLLKIYNKKTGNNKFTTKDVDITGLMFVLGDVHDGTELVYICEGLANAIIVYLATGKPVIVCINSYNMPYVSEALKVKYPRTKRVHISDNDQDKPQYGNEGVKAALLTVKYHGGWAFIPKIDGGGDIWDIYNKLGLIEVKNQIYNNKNQYLNKNYAKDIEGSFNYVV